MQMHEMRSDHQMESDRGRDVSNNGLTDLEVRVLAIKVWSYLVSQINWEILDRDISCNQAHREYIPTIICELMRLGMRRGVI